MKYVRRKNESSIAGFVTRTAQVVPVARCVLRPHEKKSAMMSERARKGVEGSDWTVDKRFVPGVGDPSRHIGWTRGHYSRDHQS